MSYEALRHFADSWGLLGMAVLFVGLVGWTFRKGATDHHQAASDLIFGDENDD